MRSETTDPLFVGLAALLLIAPGASLGNTDVERQGERERLTAASSKPENCDSARAIVSEAMQMPHSKLQAAYLYRAAAFCPRADVPQVLLGNYWEQEAGLGDKKALALARESYGLALKINPRQPSGLIGIARMYYKACNWDSAAIHLRRFLSESAGNPKLQSARWAGKRLLIKTEWLARLPRGSVKSADMRGDRDAAWLLGIVLGDVVTRFGDMVAAGASQPAYSVAGAAIGQLLMGTVDIRKKERSRWNRILELDAEGQDKLAYLEAIEGLPIAIRAQGIDSPAVGARLHVICNGALESAPVDRADRMCFCEGAALIEQDTTLSLAEYVGPEGESRTDCSFVAAVLKLEDGRSAESAVAFASTIEVADESSFLADKPQRYYARIMRMSALLTAEDRGLEKQIGVTLQRLLTFVALDSTYASYIGVDSLLAQSLLMIASSKAVREPGAVLNCIRITPRQNQALPDKSRSGLEALRAIMRHRVERRALSYERMVRALEAAPIKRDVMSLNLRSRLQAVAPAPR